MLDPDLSDTHDGLAFEAVDRTSVAAEEGFSGGQPWPGVKNPISDVAKCQASRFLRALPRVNCEPFTCYLGLLFQQ